MLAARGVGVVQAVGWSFSRSDGDGDDGNFVTLGLWEFATLGNLGLCDFAPVTTTMAIYGAFPCNAAATTKKTATRGGRFRRMLKRLLVGEHIFA